MAERWQQWMPFHIDRFRGSPDVQAMHPAARCGFLYLLASAWQTDDCSISADPLDLATASGLGDELWAVHGPRILRKFRLAEGGRMVNDVLTDEWNLAHHKFLTNQKRAEVTNEKRRASAERTSDVAENNVERTHLQEQEHIQEQKQIPLASTAVAVSAERGAKAGTMPLVGKQGNFTLYEADVSEWQESYPGIDVRQELRGCRQWLIDNPKKRKTASGIRRFINSWLSREQDKVGTNATGRQFQSFSTREEKTLLAAQNASRLDTEAADDPGFESTGDAARDGIRNLLQRVGRVSAGGLGTRDRGTLLEGTTGGQDSVPQLADNHRGDSEGREPPLPGGA